MDAFPSRYPLNQRRCTTDRRPAACEGALSMLAAPVTTFVEAEGFEVVAEFTEIEACKGSRSIVARNPPPRTTVRISRPIAALFRMRHPIHAQRADLRGRDN